ncbi:hypothetical protein [Pseudomonas nunensis]|uniref:Uncharacterized protein n=1 Tax=Pseudomonas nunensis TaxID=2961896 RepID=A0ABY5EP35_9PSED|nr:hypothetical protein [Pseudomonas nunensis]MCL5225690.1 hypothetical protein [Pseudomonas nunensis]UTO16560.1 hypothetical protein NK667_09465 [Pseudomonas nunensis]
MNASLSNSCDADHSADCLAAPYSKWVGAVSIAGNSVFFANGELRTLEKFNYYN